MRETMDSPEQRRLFIETMHELSTEQDRLFQLIAALANLLDRDNVTETVRKILDIEPVESDDCVVFGDIAIRFGADNRVKSVYKTIDGTNPVEKIVIKSATPPDN